MFSDIREEITRNFLELKMWLQDIPEGLASDFAPTSNGLFFVYLYGIYEEIVRNVIITTVAELNNANVKIDKCSYELYSVIFSPDYDALYGVGSEHKWEKRWAISRKLSDNSVINIPADIFPTDGKNIRYRQLESIAKSFGMKENILPRPEIGGYLQEMVNNRNHIAHGNKLPREVGCRYTKADLLQRCEMISEVCNYIVDVYEKYITQKQFLR